MSWLATKYVWRCRNERVKGSVRLVFLALALLVRKHCVSTMPTSSARLRRLTFLSEDQIRRNVDILVAEGEVKRLKRGKRAVYALAKMVGPLFVCDDEKPGKMQDFVWTSDDGKNLQDAGKQTGKMPEKKAARCRIPRGAHVLPVLSTTNNHNDDDAHQRPAADAYLAWFESQFPLHNNGARTRVDQEACRREVVELLKTRTLEVLQALAVEMWSLQRGDHSWIPTTDRSVRVLARTVDWLDMRVASQARLRGPARGVPRAQATSEVEVAIRMLERQRDSGVLGAACASAARRLREPGADPAALDAELLEAARRVLDAEAIEHAAVHELEPWRAKLHDAAYRDSLDSARERITREVAGLPDMRGLPPVKAPALAAEAAS